MESFGAASPPTAQTIAVDEWQVPITATFTYEVRESRGRDNQPALIFAMSGEVSCDPAPRIESLTITASDDSAVTRPMLVRASDLLDDLALRVLVACSDPNPHPGLPAHATNKANLPLYRALRLRQRARNTDLRKVADLYRQAKTAGVPTAAYVVEQLPLYGGKDPNNQARQLIHRARKAGYIQQGE